MKKQKQILLCICISAIMSISYSPWLSAQKVLVQIDPEKRYQIIDNFTAADAWSGNFVGKYWDNKEKEQIAEWLFSSGYDKSGNPKGIGLSLWRVNLGAGSWEQDNADIQPLQRRAESFLTVDGNNYDWGKCAGHRYFMQKGVEYGCNNFLLFSNSPLVQYTLNEKGWAPSDNAANIKPEYYDKYAEYLVEVTEHFTKQGCKISYISPINEPQVQWNKPKQEGSPWKKSEMKKMFVALDKALSKRTTLADVQILIGEGGSVPVLYEEDEDLLKRFGEKEAPHRLVESFFDTKSSFYVGDLKHIPRLIAGHTYHNHLTNKELKEVRQKVKDECEKFNVDYQQTEWCMLPHFSTPMDGFTNDWQKGNWGDIQVALLMGRLIHTDMVDANAKAWGYWKAMEMRGDHALIALHAKDGNIFNGGTVSANKILWALGNYSFFIRPGYTRIETSGADNLDALVASSYIAPDQSRIVTVLVNSSFDNQSINLSLPAKYQKGVKSISVFKTDERSDLAKCPDITASKKTFEYTVTPRSIITLVWNL